MRIRLSITFLLLIASAASASRVVCLHESVVDSEALTFADGQGTRFSNFVNGRTHQQTPLVTHEGYQYVIYYDGNRHVCVGRRRLPTGSWAVIRFGDYRIAASDSHNTAVIGICAKDGSIHLLFDHHVSPLHYRVSVVGAADNPGKVNWDASLFGPVTNHLGSVGPIDKVTYPRFFNAPNGNLMLYYRYMTSANGDGMLQEYNGATHDWTTGLGRFIARDVGTYAEGGESSALRCPYLNGISFAGNRLHVSWAWRDRFRKTSSPNNHDICDAYSDDHGRTWRNSEGGVIGVTGSSSVIHLNSPGLVVGEVARGRGLTNQNGHYAFPDGSIHIMVTHASEGASRRRYHHYWRDVSGRWHRNALSYSGGRPKLVGDSNGNLFLLHVDDGRFHIIGGVPNAEKTQWDWSPLYTERRVTHGGEAVVDFERWNKERVLSVYGQEKPSRRQGYGDGAPVDGTPTPLHVIDYRASAHAVRHEPSAEMN